MGEGASRWWWEFSCRKLAAILWTTFPWKQWLVSFNVGPTRKLNPLFISGVRQHALLNLVQMHYIRGEYVAARKVKELVGCYVTVAYVDATSAIIRSNHSSTNEQRPVNTPTLHKASDVETSGCAVFLTSLLTACYIDCLQQNLEKDLSWMRFNLISTPLKSYMTLKSFSMNKMSSHNFF